MFVAGLDADELRRHIKLVTAPLADSIARAREMIHHQDLVAGGKHIWTSQVMVQLIEATHHTSIHSKRTEEIGTSFPSFDRWRKDQRGSTQRMFPASLIFLASAAKHKLRISLNMNQSLMDAICNNQKEMITCTLNIAKEKENGLLSKLLAPVTIERDWHDQEEEGEEEGEEEKEEEGEEEKEEEEGEEEVFKEDGEMENESKKKQEEKQEEEKKERPPRSTKKKRAREAAAAEKRRRELKYYGVRRSSFLHGYPVQLEASVLLESYLIHYSRVCLVNEELEVAKKENLQTIQTEMVAMFQGKNC